MSNTTMNIRYAIHLANKWRDQKQAPYRNTGVVGVYHESITGWRDQLGNPAYFCPGCLAISVNGTVWEAQGGNDSEGAEEWHPRTRDLAWEGK